MTLRGGGAGSGLVKAVVTLCLLAGVFVMHGLTGNHDAAMAMGHPMPAAMAPAGGQHHVHEVAAVVEVRVGPAEDRHSMGELCLAMLTVLALAIILALAVRSLRVSHPVHWLARVGRGVAPGRSPPCVQPSLSKLCVLRI